MKCKVCFYVPSYLFSWSIVQVLSNLMGWCILVVQTFWKKIKSANLLLRDHRRLYHCFNFYLTKSFCLWFFYILVSFFCHRCSPAAIMIVSFLSRRKGCCLKLWCNPSEYKCLWSIFVSCFVLFQNVDWTWLVVILQVY